MNNLIPALKLASCKTWLVCVCVCVCVHVTTCMLCSDAHAPVLGASVKPKTAAPMEQLKGSVSSAN